MFNKHNAKEMLFKRTEILDTNGLKEYIDRP